jgi:hypothetical protein
MAAKNAKAGLQHAIFGEIALKAGVYITNEGKR